MVPEGPPRRFEDDARVEEHTPQTGVGRMLKPRQLRGYERRWLGEDIGAGVMVAALVIPLGLAFAELAGLPPVYGLYTSMLPVIVFALVASTPQAVIGAEAALSGIVAAAILPLVVDGHDPVESVALLTLLIGVACLVGAVLRLGRLAQLVSRPVFVGYLAGVAGAVIISQVPRMVGGDPYGSETALRQLGELPSIISSGNAVSAAIAAVMLTSVVIGRVVAPRFPTPLVMLMLVSVVGALFGAGSHGAAMVGALPRELPGLALVVPHLSDVVDLLPAALAIALVGFADTTMVSQGFAARNGYRVDSTRDLKALGAADVTSAVFGGLPLSASSARTAVAESTGAHSQLAPAVSAVTIGLALIGFGGTLQWVPQAALGGIIAAIMVTLVEVPAIVGLWRVHRQEFLVALTAFTGVIAFGVLQGVLAAVVISIGVFILRTIRPHDAVLGHVEGGDVWTGVDEQPGVVTDDRVLVYRFDAPLWFANVDAFRQRVLEEVAAAPATWQVILAAEAVTDLDYTASRVIEELVMTLKEQGVSLSIAGLNHEVVEQMARDGVLDAVGREHVFRTLAEAEAAASAGT